jgi:hypothetical protein
MSFIKHQTLLRGYLGFWQNSLWGLLGLPENLRGPLFHVLVSIFYQLFELPAFILFSDPEVTTSSRAPGTKGATAGGSGTGGPRGMKRPGGDDGASGSGGGKFVRR